ncbi:MAG: ABC transporter ATP-binding protein [Chthonomonas sp.]|nr:ABC transporter ATP-binding protein [Chthonomonas sp.]
MNPVCSVRGLTKTYTMGDNVIRALRGVDIDLFPGEMVAIMGPSGSGKSTFMNMLGCLDRPTAGEYLIDGRNVANLSDNELAEIRNKYIGFVFQNFQLLARTSALDNVALPLVYANKRNRAELATRALERVGLGGRLDHQPNQLSGGQQQRVAVARAIVNEPSIVLGDEPTGNLDSRTSEEIMALFQDLHKSGTTVILVTHEEDIAQHCNRIIRFRDGLVQIDERVEKPINAQEVLASMPDPDAVAAT